MEQRIILSDRFESDLALCISECEHDGIFVICDTSSHRFCWSEMAHFPTLRQAEVITIVDGDANKNLRQLTRVWERLQKGGANRHSLVINLGGGMVTDLGGFAAATFKRGLSFINVPTTLLAMVDASVGGKTGINFGGMKNEIGTFQDASRVIINTDWLKTLDTDDLRSGYAEMLKHGLLDSQERWARLVGFDLSQPDWHELAKMIEASIDIKLRYVRRDPLEKDMPSRSGRSADRRCPMAMPSPSDWSANSISLRSARAFPRSRCSRPCASYASSTARRPSVARTTTSSSRSCTTTRSRTTERSVPCS